MISSFALNYHVQPCAVLEMTLQNLAMYNMVIPSYNSKDEKGNKEVINGDDPAMQDRINRILGL